MEKFQSFLSNLGKTVVSFIRIILLSSWNIRFSIKRKSEECIILGNGPSLSDSLQNHPSFLQNKSLFCVNYFSITEYYEKIKPGFYIVNAPEIWSEDLEERRQTQFNRIFEEISLKTTWELILFLPAFSKKTRIFRDVIKPILAENNNIGLSFYNPTPVEGFKWIKHSLFRLNLGVPRPHNVLIPGIVIALNLGFKKIFLLGADHSWLKEISVDENNTVLINQKHFYNLESSKAKAMLNKSGSHRKLHELLMKLVYSFEGYFILKEYADRLGASVVNATPESFIDAFERFDYSSETV